MIVLFYLFSWLSGTCVSIVQHNILEKGRMLWHSLESLTFSSLCLIFIIFSYFSLATDSIVMSLLVTSVLNNLLYCIILLNKE